MIEHRVPVTVMAALSVMMTTAAAATLLAGIQPAANADRSGGATASGAADPRVVVPARPDASTAVLLAAGDIASCRSNGDEATAKLLDKLAGTVAALGDNAYVRGTARDFARCYHPSWGRHRARTRPAVGNHEYRSPGARPYYAYFGTAAGSRARGYYSYNLGTWHVVVLNSNCRIVSCATGSAQELWLRTDLAKHQRRCTLAYWHHPLFTSGAPHGNSVETRPLFETLYRYDADVVLTGHNHHYERFGPQNPRGFRDTDRGIRSFVVGTGGASHYPFGKIKRNSQVRNDNTYGVLKLSLRPGGYDWRFVPVAGKSFTDTGSDRCH